MRPVANRLGHERPFEAGRKTGTTASTQPRCLDLVDDGVATLFENRLGAIPSTASLRATQPPIMAAIEVSENAVLVRKHRLGLARFGGVATTGSERCRLRDPPFAVDAARKRKIGADPTDLR